MASLARRIVVTVGDLAAHTALAGAFGAVVFNAITLFRFVAHGGPSEELTWEFVAFVSVAGAVLCGGYAAVARAVQLCRGDHPRRSEEGGSMGLSDAIRRIADTASAAPAAAASPDAGAAGHARYHRRIVAVGGGFAAVGVVFGIASAIVVLIKGEVGNGLLGLFVMPVMFGIGGFMFGMAVTCLAAPRSFLTGPAGRPWMELIGTESVAVARLACLLFGLAVTAPFVGFGLMIALRQ